MEKVNVVYVDNTPIAIPAQQGSHTTAFLLQMSRLLKENRTSMDVLSRTPVTEQDIWDSATVVPL